MLLIYATTAESSVPFSASKTYNIVQPATSDSSINYSSEPVILVTQKHTVQTVYTDSWTNDSYESDLFSKS